MRRKYLRFEQLEVFRPMPVPDASGVLEIGALVAQ